MLKTRHSAVAALTIGLTCAIGQAAAVEPVATLAQIQGVTLVNQGGDYVTANVGMVLNQGDRVMAMEGGNATLKFVDGCIHTLTDNTILTVGAPNSCSTGTLAANQVGPYVAAAGAAGGVVGTGAITAGILAGVVLIGATAVDTGSDDREDAAPPSP